MAPKIISQRNAGMDFYNRKRQAEQTLRDQEGVVDEVTENKMMAEQMADRQATKELLETPASTIAVTPTEELQQGMVTGDPTGAETFVGTDPTNLGPQETPAVFPEIEVTESTLDDLEARGMRQYEQSGLFPNPTTDTETQLDRLQLGDAAEGTISQEAAGPRGIITPTDTGRKLVNEINNFVISEIGDKDGYASFKDVINFSSEAFNVNNRSLNIFGSLIDIENISANELDVDPQGVIYRNSDTFNYALKGDRKLNLLADNSDPNSAIRDEVGPAFMMSTIISLSNKMIAMNSETDTTANDRQFENALDRSVLGNEISRLAERIMYPTQMNNPDDVFKGESERYGYKSRLTDDEHTIVGEVILQGFTSANWNNLFEEHTVLMPNGNTKIVFKSTRIGEQKINAMRRGIRQQLGMSALRERPVSGVPTDSGRQRGAAAFTQKRDTGGPLYLDNRTKTVQAGIDAMASVQHTVPMHLAILSSGILASATTYKSDNVFSDVSKQSDAYFQKKKAQLLKDYKDKASKVGKDGNPMLTPAMLGSYFNTRFQREMPYDTFEQAAEGNARQIVENHLQERIEEVGDGFNRVNTPFYYGYTTINNSTRMMITNDELNYQSSKLSRFLVANAKPVLFTKSDKGSDGVTGARKALNSAIKKAEANGDKSPDSAGYKRYTPEEGFFRVIARSVIVGAEKMSRADQLKALLEELTAVNPETGKPTMRLAKFGAQLLKYTQDNEQFNARVQDSIANNKPMPNPKPLNVTPELQAFLKEHNKNETFYFAMDALHELTRYLTTPDGAKFGTRVKAEVDGNSNGATIQAYQMGVENILRKGGVLYQLVGNKYEDEVDLSTISREEAEALEGDIRDDVFNLMVNQGEVANEGKTYWTQVFTAIALEPTLVKALMKLPIMTSIYGQDPKFHKGHARKFINDNPALFENLAIENGITDVKLVEELAKHLETGLTLGLGGALEHAKMAKRIGRAHNFANEIMVTVGPNGAPVQAGGFEYIDKDPVAAGIRMPVTPTGQVKFNFGPGTQANRPGSPARQSMNISLKERVPSASVPTSTKYLGEGEYNTPELGSKLSNQAAVNGTQNIDATVSQVSVARQIKRKPDGLVMQIYDGFIGDASSFSDLEQTVNTVFDEVNQAYNMLEAERQAFQEMLARTKEKIDKAKETGEMFDIGTEGAYKSLGDFYNVGSDMKPRYRSIIRRDMSTSTEKERTDAMKKAKIQAKGIITTTGQQLGDKSLKIDAETYEALFNATLDLLNIKVDLDKMIVKTNSKRNALNKERRKRAQFT